MQGVCWRVIAHMALIGYHGCDDPGFQAILVGAVSTKSAAMVIGVCQRTVQRRVEVSGLRSPRLPVPPRARRHDARVPPASFAEKVRHTIEPNAQTYTTRQKRLRAESEIARRRP